MRAALMFAAAAAALAAAAASKDARAATSDALDALMDKRLNVTPDKLESANLRAFLAMIRAGEGTADADGYRRLFGGRLFVSLADHPRTYVTAKLAGKPITSSAAGAYQILEKTWNDVQAALRLPDFSPLSQDLAAVWLIRRRGALADVLAGRFDEAVRKCALEWASLPGSPYGQPVKTLAQARSTYETAGGTYA